MQHKVTKVSSFAEVREYTQAGEKSLHATVTFMPGEVISTFGSRETLSTPNYLTVQLDEQEHILLAPEFLQYINHSCDPNVFFDTANKVVTCLQEIEVGEEMTFFYPSTEWSMEQKFQCHCGTERCLGYIQGATHLHLDILNTYQLSAYIQHKLKLSLDEEKQSNVID